MQCFLLQKKGAPSCLVNATFIRSALSSPEPCMECTNMRKHQLVVWLANDVYAEHTPYACTSALSFLHRPCTHEAHGLNNYRLRQQALFPLRMHWRSMFRRRFLELGAQFNLLSAVMFLCTGSIVYAFALHL